MLKTYKFIVINKSNMSELRHFARAEDVADLIYPKFDFGNWIIIKDENTVIDLVSASLFYVAGSQVNKHRCIVSILERE